MPFLKPGAPPPRDVYPKDIPALVENMRRWIGADRLNAQLQEYTKRHASATGVKKVRLLERQAVISGFEDYRKQTLNGQRPLRSVTEEISMLTNVAGLFRTIQPTLTGGIERHHRGRLLDLNGQLQPLILEWAMAAFYARKHGAEIDWLEASSTGPELRARARGFEWELECKRLTPMVTELFGDSEADNFASTCIDAIKNAGFCGEINLTLPINRTIFTDEELRQASTELRERILQGSRRFLILGDISVESSAVVAQGQSEEAQIWNNQMREKQNPEARLYGYASSAEGQAVNPIVLQLAASRRTSADLLNYLWERKFKVAAEQCTSLRGAVLAFEWSGISDPTVFVESEGVQALISRTFEEYRHVGIIAMRCAMSTSSNSGEIRMDTSAYVTKSNVCIFPEILDLEHLDA